MLKFVSRSLIILVLALPTLAAALWTCHPAALAAWAMLDFKPITLTKADWGDPIRLLELRRQVQRHFLDHSVYIPMEDIIAGAPGDASTETLSLLMQKACGQGRIFIWIPFKFHLPVTGEKVIEWCWKPQT